MTVKLAVKKDQKTKSTSKKAETIIGEENVVIKDETMTATSERAKYVVAEKKLYLTGNPVVRQRDSKTGKVNVYRGSRIIYHTGTKQIDFENLDAEVKNSEEK